MFSSVLLFLGIMSPIEEPKKFDLHNIGTEDRIKAESSIVKYYGRPISDLIINNIDIFIYDPKSGQYLIAKRSKLFTDGEWFLLGGRQRAGETYFEFAIRTAKEDLGIDIEPKTCIYNYEVVNYNADGSVKNHINSQVVFALFKSSEFSMPEHIAFYRWLPIEVCRNIMFSETTYAYFNIIYDKAVNYIIINDFEEKVSLES